MTLFAALMLMLGAPSIEVSLAPDQPIPFVYVDDPLILQIKANAESDLKITGKVTFTGTAGQSAVVDLPAISLRAQGTHWHQVEGAPPDRGQFQTHVALNVNGQAAEFDLAYCRIDRPNAKLVAPLGVHLQQPDDKALVAFQGIPARQVCMNADIEHIEEAVERAVKSGCLVSLLVDASKLPNAPERCEVLARTLLDKVAAWIVTVPEASVAFDAIAEAVRKGGSRAAIMPMVSNEQEIATLLANGAGRFASSVVLRNDMLQCDSLGGLRAASESLGYEGFGTNVMGIGADPLSTDAGLALVQNCTRNLAGGARLCLLEPGLLFSEGKFQDGYVYTTALVNRLGAAQYVGPLEMPKDIDAYIFRVGNTWTLLLWANKDEQDVSIGVGDATQLVCSNAVNNPISVPEGKDGDLSLHVTHQPMYLSGSGGDLLTKAARNMARREAQAFVGTKAFQEGLPPELMAIMKSIADIKGGKPDRLNFFAILRLFPVLEQKWHEGQMGKEVAVPAMASMSRLVRTLCVLEQEAGEPFLEVLQATLDRCGEYQSQYLTGSGGTNNTHERADWLLAEVGRLMSESKSLVEQGREIEATGVASLAEWRARSLEFAAKAAPLSPVHEQQ
ncbi:MAG: hypothetical protein K1Y02_00960 [Candidatus Hydrogenedentes bacterium]|nr:hypothetical protein [Candidatus Hydrogenedentota bacterium]